MNKLLTISLIALSMSAPTIAAAGPVDMRVMNEQYIQILSEYQVNAKKCGLTELLQPTIDTAIQMYQVGINDMFINPDAPATLKEFVGKYPSDDLTTKVWTETIKGLDDSVMSRVLNFNFTEHTTCEQFATTIPTFPALLQIHIDRAGE